MPLKNNNNILIYIKGLRNNNNDIRSTKQKLSIYIIHTNLKNIHYIKLYSTLKKTDERKQKLH